MPTVRRMKAKVALMGEGGVGKTSLVRRFVFNEYQDTYLHTVGTRVSKIELTVPHAGDLEIRMDMSIFDIVGQREFQDLVRETFFHGAQALMAVCDLTRLDSLTALDYWIPSALQIAGDVPLYIVVNKKDLEDRRAFGDEQIQKVTEAYGAPYILSSAKTGELVDDAFNSLAIEIVDRALRSETRKAAERGMRGKLLELMEKRGSLGLKKAQFREILRGIDFDELQRELSIMESEGLIVLLWHGPADFTATITPKGVTVRKESASSLEEE